METKRKHQRHKQASDCINAYWSGPFPKLSEECEGKNKEAGDAPPLTSPDHSKDDIKEDMPTT
jgi:hypothetical protein